MINAIIREKKLLMIVAPMIELWPLAMVFREFAVDGLALKAFLRAL